MPAFRNRSVFRNGSPLRNLKGTLNALPRDVIVLSAISFLVAVGFGVVVPVLPVFAKSFGADVFQAAVVVSAFAVVRLITSPFCGRFIDWVGERLVLAIGIGIVAASSALAGIAQSYVQLLALRAMGGVGSAMFTVSAMTLLLSSAPAEIRARAAGVYQGGFLLGNMTGPAIGGLLSAISLTAPFFFYAAMLVIAGGVGLVLLSRRTAHAATGQAQTASVPLRQVIADVRYRAACLANLAQGWNSIGVRSAIIPVLVVEVLHQEPRWTGIAFACSAVVQTIAIGPAGAFVDRHGRRTPMIAAGLLATGALVGIAVVPNLAWLVVLLCIYGLAAAFLGTAPAAAVGDVAGAHGGRPVAVFSMCADVGAIVGPLAAGLLVDHVSYPVALGAGAALMAVSGLYAIRMPRGRVRPDEGALA